MNDQSTIAVTRGEATGKRPATPTPVDLDITVRDRRFGRSTKAVRWWVGGDPVATAWYNALSASFPRGEAFFIESVRSFRDSAPADLAEDIRRFIKQEVNHSREHVALNRAATEAGFALDVIDDRIARMLEMTRDRPPVVNLAVTMALEHFTAIFARQLLEDPSLLEGADPELAALWRWHAIEEIEHKAVAYDTFLFATQGMKPRKRWMFRALTMLDVTRRFVGHRYADMLTLLAQDGITGWRARARVLWFLGGRPGALRRMIPSWAAFFLPGFHPWNHDERGLLARADAELAAA